MRQNESKAAQKQILVFQIGVIGRFDYMIANIKTHAGPSLYFSDE